MNNNEEKKEKVLSLFDKEDIKYIRFDILNQFEKVNMKENILVKKIGDKDVNKKR